MSDFDPFASGPLDERIVTGEKPYRRKLPFFPQPKPGARVVDKEAARKLASQREVKFRNQVWKDSKYVCAFCGRKVERTLELTASQGHVDHIKPRSTSPALRFDPKNGRVLCRGCHDRRH